MPTVPTVSPATGSPTTSAFIHTLDSSFVDNHGRTLLLRGVNLSGASKAPIGRHSHILEEFWERAEAGNESFIGRPLNLDDGSADVHLARLRGWGFNILRFPVTWEALEHEGPGKYDDEFMDYIVQVLRKCKEYGFKVFMDPHQDTWSRFSGGSGAPFWTLPACGFNHQNITATQAALLHNEHPSPSNPDPASFPAMIWSTNYGRLFNQTVWTLFFAGRTFAPKCVIDGVNIQDYLQSHFIEAFGRLADRIRDAGDLLDTCVIAWDPVNEPSEGLIQWEDLNVTPKVQGNTLKKGPSPTPAQSFRLGIGQPQTVDNWTFGPFGPSKSGTITVDPKGHKLWADAVFLNEDSDGVNLRWGWKRDPGWDLGTCLWASHGVWDVQTGYMLRPDYFTYFPHGPSAGLPVEFLSDFWVPFFADYTKRIRSAHPEAIMFVQPPVFAPPPKIEHLGEGVLKGRAAYAPHYYDGLTLITKHWNWFNADALGLLRGKYSSTMAAVKIGTNAIRGSFRDQLGYYKEDALTISHGGYPTIIGEIGTPYDMDDKRSYGYTDGGKHVGDYDRQEKALDASLNGADGRNALSFTLWNYCPDGSWEWGDGWNGEDLSLWSEDDLKDDLLLKDALIAGGDTQSIYSTLGKGDSQVTLLRKRGNKASSSLEPRVTVTTASATASSLSLATLSPSSQPPIDRQPQPHARPVIPSSRKNSSPSPSPQLSSSSPSILLTPRQQVGYSPNMSPFDFLTNGARAWKAFNRPTPIAVVGCVADMQFDIEGKSRGNRHKAPEFRCTIRVASGDRAVVQNGGEEEALPTEIFLPLVHFGSDRWVYQSMNSCSSSSSNAGVKVLGTDSESGDSDEIAQTFEGQRGSEETLDVPTQSRDYESATRINDDENSEPQCTTSMAVDTSHISLYPPNTADLLDIEVDVSEGTWRMKGQVLEWFYDTPPSQANEGEKEVSIEVRRRGGPIKADKTRSRDRSEGKREMNEAGEETVCQKICGDCVVM